MMKDFISRTWNLELITKNFFFLLNEIHDPKCNDFIWFIGGKILCVFHLKLKNTQENIGKSFWKELIDEISIYF